MTECPTCGKDGFSSRQYMRSHHKQSHGESIAGFEYTCEWCGDTGVKSQIDDYDDHQFCSTECYHEWRAQTLVGENSPVWEGRTVVIECDCCGSESKRAAVIIEKHENSFCSHSCHSRWMAEQHEGDRFDAPRLRYGPNWREERRERMERDGYECVACQMSNAEHKRVYDMELHVHHVEPARNFATNGVIDYEQANRIENLITLCVRCHGRYEGVPIDTGERP